MADQRITSSQPDTWAPTTASACDAEWYVIHAGQERGPFSFAELVGKAALGEIAADDLVKQTGGLWTKGAILTFSSSNSS